MDIWDLVSFDEDDTLEFISAEMEELSKHCDILGDSLNWMQEDLSDDVLIDD